MTRERQLVETFVEVADTLDKDFDVNDFLHTLADRCVQFLDVEAAGIVLIDKRGHLHAAAASSKSARLVGLFELQSDAGPCVDCCRSGRPVVNADLDAHTERWPRFADAARASGFAAVHALPLRRRETVIGALNLFGTDNRVLTGDNMHTGQALADVATIGILAQRGLHRAELQATQLQNALNSRIVIEQAKGILAERQGISVEAAFTLLREYSRAHNARLSDTAREVAEGSTTAPELLRTGVS
ncbi:GAF and ANTAR domain-containing protein [Catenulispora yoronensis]|uniref:GAF and ANTAR domain-containing protein n=1 Tax=Catenulispora yoronensis TaxID=450799 RepID=A0ABN2TVB6_9ACTN